MDPYILENSKYYEKVSDEFQESEAIKIYDTQGFDL